MRLSEAAQVYRDTGDAAVVREAIREAWREPGSTVRGVMVQAELELLAVGRDPRLVIARSWR